MTTFEEEGLLLLLAYINVGQGTIYFCLFVWLLAGLSEYEKDLMRFRVHLFNTLETVAAPTIIVQDNRAVLSELLYHFQAENFTKKILGGFNTPSLDFIPFSLPSVC